MAGDSDLTALVKTKNTVQFFSTAGILTTDTGAAYLDVSTMDASQVLFLVGKVGGKTGTLKIQDGAAYSGGTIGDLTQLTSAGTGRYAIGPLETSRFKDSNGFIKIFKDTVDTDVFTVTAILL